MANFCNGDFAGTDFKPAIFDALQARGNFFVNFFNRPSFAKNGNCAYAGFDVAVARNGAVQNRAEHLRNGVFGFARRGDGNSPKRFVFHFQFLYLLVLVLVLEPKARTKDEDDYQAQSRHGVKLSNSTSAMCGCNATCVTLAYSISN